MNERTERQNGDRLLTWLRRIGWGTAVLLLLAPLVAMRFTTEVNWTVGDFIFAGLLFGAVGLALELAVRISSSWYYRLGAGLGVAAGFFLIWANGAVGYIGSEDNPYNQLFFYVIAIAFAALTTVAAVSRAVAPRVCIAPVAAAACFTIRATFGTAVGATIRTIATVGAPVVAPLAAGVCVFALALTVVAAGRVRVDLVVAARAVSGRARTAAAAVTAPVAAPLAVAVVVSRGLRLGQSAVRVARGGSTHVASRASST